MLVPRAIDKSMLTEFSVYVPVVFSKRRPTTRPSADPSRAGGPGAESQPSNQVQARTWLGFHPIACHARNWPRSELQQTEMDVSVRVWPREDFHKCISNLQLSITLIRPNSLSGRKQLCVFWWRRRHSPHHSLWKRVLIMFMHSYLNSYIFGN